MSVEQSVTDEPGYDDNLEYFQSNQTVRIVTIRSNDVPTEFVKWSFEEWATFETATVARQRAVEAAVNRLEATNFSSAVAHPPQSAATDDSVIWLYLTTYVENGEVVRTPPISLQEMVEKAPRSVDATVSLKKDSFSRSVPVYAAHRRKAIGVDSE